MGNEFLYNIFPEVYPHPEESHNRRSQQHTLKHIKDSLRDVHIRKSWGFLASFTAFDVFCGYLLLDTLISNQDRHHENWAVLYDIMGGRYFLCETYDHAASLGRELTPERRATLLSSPDVNQRLPAFVAKARSEIFENETDTKPMLTLDAFKLACDLQPTHIKRFWLERLRSLSNASMLELLASIPEQVIVDATKHFVFEMLLQNKQRILENVK